MPDHTLDEQLTKYLTDVHSIEVSGGRRVNVPRDDEGEVMESASPSVTAIVFD